MWVPLNSGRAASSMAARRFAPEDMPAALHASQNIMALPFHPYLEEEQVQQVTAALREALHE